MPPETRAEMARHSKIAKAEKRRTILAQYAGGATVERIADLNGWTPASVHSIIQKAVESYRGDTIRSVESVRATQLMRLDTLLTAVMAKASDGDLAAVREVVRIETLRAKITGTFRAPEGTKGGDLHLHLVDPARVKELEASFRASGQVVESDAVELPPDPLLDAG